MAQCHRCVTCAKARARRCLAWRGCHEQCVRRPSLSMPVPHPCASPASPLTMHFPLQKCVNICCLRPISWVRRCHSRLAQLRVLPRRCFCRPLAFPIPFHSPVVCPQHSLAHWWPSWPLPPPQGRPRAVPSPPFLCTVVDAPSPPPLFAQTCASREAERQREIAVATEGGADTERQRQTQRQRQNPRQRQRQRQRQNHMGRHAFCRTAATVHHF